MISLRDLNPQQRQAVETINGPVLVLSGAGTGKTRTISYRIAHMLDQGIASEHILAVTFTNKAAREMRERVRALVGDCARLMQVSTFHSLGARIVREHAAQLGLRPQFAIYDGNEQLALVKKALRGISVTWKKFRPEDILFRMQNGRCWHDETLQVREDDVDSAVTRSVWESYRGTLRACNAVDFEDLLLMPLRLFHTQPTVLQQYRNIFRYVLVDEYQDTNSTQFDFIHALAGEHRNICVVGDDDQSIYGWRGAEVRNILEFETHFPDPTVVRLEENYRSTSVIVNAANAVIQKNEARRPKQLWTRRNGGAIIRCQAATDEMDEAELVVADLLEHQRAHKRSYSDYAILMRMNTQARPFEEALRRYNVPYVVVGGMQFYDRKEIRDCLSYLRLLVNTNDEEALLRVVNVPPRGAGEATVRKLAEYADNAGISLYRALGDLDHIADIQPSTKRALQGLFELFEQWRARLAHDRPSLVARGLWTELDYRRELEGGNLTAEQVDERLANVNVLLDSIDYYERSVGQPSLDEFLQQITLLNRDDEEELAKGRVAVMTIHAGKGLEFPYVYIVGALQGVLPHAKSVTGPQGMAEERRLFYVAVTRARDELMISYPAARLRHGTLEQCKPSEFLDDIPAELLAWDRNAFAGKASGEQVASMVDRFRKQIAEAE